jgi:thioesterase domain-containing protein
VTTVLARQLEQYLHDEIPLSRAMQVHVAAVDAAGVTLSAPLAPNINHHETVFGGSAAALAILSCWSLVHVRLRAVDLKARLVIQRNTMEYERPITGEFRARAAFPSEDVWPAFVAMLSRRGRARISVVATLEHGGVRAGRFTGQFVALRSAGD